MLTSNFSIMSKHPNAVSIALTDPYFYKGIRYSILAPPRDLLSAYKLGTVTEEEYTKIYTERVLDRLDPRIVYQDLGPHAVLLCHCSAKPNVFCHRHLVSAWLRKTLGVSIYEYSSIGKDKHVQIDLSMNHVEQ